MHKKIFTLFVGALLATVLVSSSAFAAKPSAPSKTSTPLGIDVSWPQCDKVLPSDHAFGIVGVNHGLANNTNDCLSEQLVWSQRAPGTTTQEKTQMYVNTANPGGLNTDSWPRNNVAYDGTESGNPHGTCDGSDSLACAWQYGWNRALEDDRMRFQPNAALVGIDPSASAYVWWLDVETENTWKTGGTDFDYQSNVAVLEGMTRYLSDVGARVGLYSTAAQWSQIVGNAVSGGSNLNNMPNWRPGGATQKTAKDACSAKPLTSGGAVILTQFVSRGLDYDYVCS